MSKKARARREAKAAARAEKIERNERIASIQASRRSWATSEVIGVRRPGAKRRGLTLEELARVAERRPDLVPPEALAAAAELVEKEMVIDDIMALAEVPPELEEPARQTLRAMLVKRETLEGGHR